MKTTDEQRAELRRKQQAATPGPWVWCEYGLKAPSAGRFEAVLYPHNVLGDASTPGGLLGSVGDHAEDHRDDNAAFIAAANPETVGALLDDVDELRAQLDDARHAISEMEKNREEAIDITTRREYAQQAEIDELRERVRELEKDAQGYADGWTECEKERDAARKRIAELEARVRFYEEREAYFARLFRVADAGQYCADWDDAVARWTAEIRNAALEAAAEPLAGRGPHVQVNAAAEAERIRGLKRGT